MELNAPLHIHWEITNKCNFNCIQCYQQNDKVRDNLSDRDLMNIAKKIVDAGVFQVSVSGGEPFLVKNIVEILTYLKENNVDLVVCSNGSYLKDEHIDVMKNYKIPIQISLDSSFEEKNNKIRGNEQAFSLAISCIKKLINNNIEVSLAFCATKYNYLDIEGVTELCFKLGIQRLVIGEVLPVYGGFNYENLLFEEETYAEFLRCIKILQEKYSNIDIFVNSEWGFLYSDICGHAPCTALDRDFAILHNGYVTPCPFIRNPNYFLGNLLKMDVSTIWKKGKETAFYKAKHLGCSDKCKYYISCLGGCKAQLANTNGQIERKDPRCPLQ